MLPGWDSLALTSAYAKWFTYAGFAALFLLGVFEIFGHAYSVHEATLTAAAVARDADNKRASADARIAEAQRGSAEANERAIKAQASLSLAEQHSAEANAKAEGFRLDIAKANERAASANETAESERLARLQLEARLADRTLTSAQQASIASQLSTMHGIVVDALTFGDTPEIQIISGLVVESLRKAGWTVNAAQAGGGGVAVRGILVGAKTDAGPEIARAANLLVAALRSAGLASGSWAFEELRPPAVMFTSSFTGTAPIRMFIGSKQ